MVRLVSSISIVSMMCIGFSLVLLMLNLEVNSEEKCFIIVLMLLNGVISVSSVISMMMVCSVVDSSMFVCFSCDMFRLVLSRMVWLILLLVLSI